MTEESKNRDLPLVLVVDDSPESIDMLVGILKDSYKIKVAKNGQRALEIAQAEPGPDLILLDIIMPGMDGYEVCRRLKADPSTERIPIIFATGMEDDGNEETGLQLGADDYVSKPFSAAIVKKRIATQLELSFYRSHHSD
ncbi:MAG: response regulator [Sedimenticola sp.]